MEKRTLRDAIYGQAVGDALGLPVQFKYRDQYPRVETMLPDAFSGTPKGTFSDDTSMALAICDSIRTRGYVDTAGIRRNFEAWLYEGKYTQIGEAFDIGSTCEETIESGKGLADEWSQGNGSLMRTIPLAFVPDITDEAIREVSAITHAHPNCMEACVCYVKIARDLLAGIPLKESILSRISDTSVFQRIRQIENCRRQEIRSTGFVVDTFEAAMWCLLTTDNYRDCLIKAVNLGQDTDSIGAVAGGLAGILYGMESIPKEWIDCIYKKMTIERYLFAF